jgi:cytochrome c
MRLLLPLLLLLSFAGCTPPVPGEAGRPVRSDTTDEFERGELLSLACQACHSLTPGGPQMVGPTLHGVFGRSAATAPGYNNYSSALRNSGLVWSPAELDQWLADPAGYLPGTLMAFTGYQSAEDRAALIAFLQAATTVD